MSRLKTYTLLVVILICAFGGIVGGGYLYYYEEAQNDSLIGSLKQQIQLLKAKLEDAQKENEALRTQLSSSADTSLSESVSSTMGATPFDNPGVLDLPTLMEKMMQNRDATTEGGSEAKPSMESILDMAKQFSESPVFGKMMVNQQYDGLFSRLNLSPERQEALMAILLENSKTAMSSVFGMMDVNGRKDYEAKEKEIKEMETQLRGKVAGVLSTDEMAVYDDYETNKYTYMAKDQMLNELLYMSDQVSEPSMNRFVDVFLENEESLRGATDPTMPFDPEMPFDPNMAMGDIFGQRADAMQETLDQLSTELTPEELAALTRHVEMQRMQAAQMQTMMESMGMDESIQEIMQEMGLPFGESTEKE